MARTVALNACTYQYRLQLVPTGIPHGSVVHTILGPD